MSKRAIDPFRLPATPNPQTSRVRDPVSQSVQEPPERTTDQPAPSNTGVEQPEESLADSVTEPISLDATAIASNPQTHKLTNTLPNKLSKGHRQSDYAGIASQVATQIVRGARVLGMPLVWIGVAAFCVGTGYSAFLWLTSVPDAPACDRLWFFSLAPDKLLCAERAAQKRDEASLLKGLSLLQHWSTHDPLYKRVVQLRKEWSKALLAIAHQKALHNDVAGAIALARQIQSKNPDDRNAEKAIVDWESSGTKIKAAKEAVESALKTQDWQKAEAQLQALKGLNSDYGQQQRRRLREQVDTERIAYSRLQQLRELVTASSADDVETLGRVIYLAMQISPNTNAKAEAENDIPGWIRSLVEATSNRLAAGDLPGAIAAVKWLPETIPMPPDVQNLFWFNRAQQLSAKPSSRLITDMNQHWQLVATLAAVRQIQPDSPFYSQVQPQFLELEKRLQDTTQLQFANRIATLQQVPALQLAIRLAEDITPDRPQRLQAQALMAVWRQDIQRAEDRPYLLAAQRLAASGKIPDLQAAIAQASRIPLGRALRPDAQAAIFTWQQRIQTIEDGPILTQARQLAKQTKLAAAIRVAEKIQPGRALYSEAQAAIQTWVATIQTAEDRPVLDRAIALADQSDFGAAIEIASRITPNRALYEQAQAAIARWSAQRERRRVRSASANQYDNDRRYNENLPAPNEDSLQYRR